MTLRPQAEAFRLGLAGAGRETLARQLKAVALAVDHPVATGLVDELLVLRGPFWQGAGAPFGPRSAWLPEDAASELPRPASAYPLAPLDHTMTNEPGAVLAWRAWLALKAQPLPGWPWRAGLLVIALAGTWLTHGTLLGQHAGVTLVVVLLALKTL